MEPIPPKDTRPQEICSKGIDELERQISSVKNSLILDELNESELLRLAGEVITLLLLLSEKPDFPDISPELLLNVAVAIQNKTV